MLFLLADIGAGDDMRGFVDWAGADFVAAGKAEDLGIADAGLDLLPRQGHGRVGEILQAVEGFRVAQELHRQRAEGAGPPWCVE